MVGRSLPLTLLERLGEVPCARRRRRVELLAQTLSAYRSCLEIYTPETFPLEQKRAQGTIEGMRAAAS
jgi:hypothetical protein